MTRGKLILAKFPFTNLSSYKRRPALVISPQPNMDNDVIVAFISSKIPEHKEATDLLIAPKNTNGLKRLSIIKLDKIATINQVIISGEIGQIEDQYIAQINEKLKLSIGLV